MDNPLKPTNPKDALGGDRVPIHLWPNTATVMGSMGLLDGMLKYGRSNWRPGGVRASVYYDAARRHLDRWFEGYDTDPDSGLSELCHVLSCLAIITDAEAMGTLNDDRMFPGGYDTLRTAMTPHVARLKEKHKGRDPKHYTIIDG
jgi:hypothetical protein